MDKQAKREKKLTLLQEINLLEQAHKESACEIKDVYKCVDEKCTTIKKIQEIGKQLANLSVNGDGRRKPFDLTEKQYYEFKESGLTDLEISRKVDIELSRIRNWKTRNGIKTHIRQKDSHFEENRKRCLELFSEGLKPKEIATILNVSVKHVYKIRKSKEAVAK